MQPAKPPLRVFLNCFQFEIALHSVEEFTHANVLFLAFRYCDRYEIASILLVTLAAVLYLISANHFSNINIFVVETLSLCSLKILTWLIHLVKTSGYPAYIFSPWQFSFFAWLLVKSSYVLDLEKIPTQDSLGNSQEETKETTGKTGRDPRSNMSSFFFQIWRKT